MSQAYLTFVISFTQKGFSKTNFYTQKTTKGTKNTKNVSEKVKCMHFFHSIWKNLHLTENFYTGTARGARDKYEVCLYQPGFDRIPTFCKIFQTLNLSGAHQFQP